MFNGVDLLIKMMSNYSFYILKKNFQGKIDQKKFWKKIHENSRNDRIDLNFETST